MFPHTIRDSADLLNDSAPLPDGASGSFLVAELLHEVAEAWSKFGGTPGPERTVLGPIVDAAYQLATEVIREQD